MRSARWSIPNAMLAGVLALALCSGGTVFGGGVFSRAWADEAEEAQKAVDDAQATLDDAEAHMESIAGDYDALKQDVEELQARVDEISAQAVDAQQAVIEGRAALGKTAVHEYLNGGASQSLVTMVLEARSFSDLIRNLTYLDSIMQFHADEVEAQKERSAKYEKLIDDLNFQKDEQEKKLEELEAKRAEAETVLSQASSKLSNAQSRAFGSAQAEGRGAGGCRWRHRAGHRRECGYHRPRGRGRFQHPGPAEPRSEPSGAGSRALARSRSGAKSRS